MKIGASELLEDLTERTRQNKIDAGELEILTMNELNWRPGPESWSALECVEHLNRYGEFYLPEIKRAIEKSNHAPEPEFKSGLLGNYFANMMLPRPGFKKIKTFKDKNPLGSELNKTNIQKFILQQEELLKLLDQATKVSLGRTKAAISLSKFVKLKLGDIFRVVIYHNQRHLEQAQRVLGEMQSQDT